jgi:hypothetical protein
MSLEYGSIENARASKGMCGGEWIFRLSENPGWEQALHEAMQVFFHTLCRSPYNYEGPSSKPEQVRSAVPQVCHHRIIACFDFSFFLLHSWKTRRWRCSGRAG